MNLLETASAIDVQGFLHPEELEKLVELARNKEVLEIGAFRGLSAWGMAIVATRVTSIDTFKANSAGQTQMEALTTLVDYQEATKRFANVEFVIGTSEQLAGLMRFTTTAFDMIFLDAMHTYEDVKADIHRWWPRIRQNGLMVFHDYGHDDFPGVKKAVDEIFGELPNRVITLGWLTKT